MTESAVERPAWMHKNFRYPPSSPEAVAVRALCVPGPNWVPNLQAENRRMVAERAELLATVERMREELDVAAVHLQLAGGWLREAGDDGQRTKELLRASNRARRAALTTGEAPNAGVKP